MPRAAVLPVVIATVLGLATPALVPDAADAAPAAAATAGVGWFHPVAPALLADTAHGVGTSRGAVAGGKYRVVQVAGHGGVPASGARAVDVLLGASGATRATTVTAVADGAAKPSAALLSAPKAAAVATSATVPVGGDGAIRVWNATGAVQVTVTVVGWFGASSSSRGSSDLAGAAGSGAVVAGRATIAAGHSRTVLVAGHGGVPAHGAVAARLRLVVAAGAHAVSVTVHSASRARPRTPVLTVPAHGTAVAATDVLLGTGSHAGRVLVEASGGAAAVTVVGLGWFGAAGTSASHVLKPLPVRQIASTTIGSRATRTITVAGAGGVPRTGALEAVLSVTALRPSRATAVTVYASTGARPSTSTLAAPRGRDVSGWTVVPLTGGRIRLYNSAGSTAVRVAVEGYFVAAPTVPAPPPGGGTRPDAATLAAIAAAAGRQELFTEAPVRAVRTDTFTLDTAHAVTNTVGWLGGQLVVQSGGATLTLTIPGGALPDAVAITATPVASVGGAAGVGATAYGLQLAPEGLVLLKPATLVIAPPGTTHRHAIGLDATADGSAVEPDEVALDRNSLSMVVSHFSIHVVLESNGDGGFSAKYFTDEQYAATLHDQLVKYIQDNRDRMIDDPNFEPDPTELAQKLNQYWDAIVQPIIETSNGTPGAPGSCQFYRENYDKVDAASHERAVLGTSDGDARLASALNGLGLGLQHCWKEAESQCMIAGHWADALLIASRMSVLGVHTAEGTTPDPFSLYWCGTANGYIDVAIDSHLVNPPNGPDNMTNHFRYWITAMPLKNPPSQGGAYRLSLVNMGTTLDLTFDERSDFYWNGGSCTKTSTTHLSFTGRSSTFSYGGEFTSGDVGLNTDTGVYGYGDLFPTQTAITNNCGTNSTAPAYVQADLGRLHTEHVDRAGGNLVFGGEHTEGGPGTGHLLHYVYSGSIHIDGLESLLG